MKKIIYAVTLFISLQANSQSSNSETLLCNAGWVKTGWTVNPAKQVYPNWPVASDLFALERPCTKDDFYVFSLDGTYQLLNGKNKCSDGEADLISSGKWAFLKMDRTILNMVKGGKGGMFQKKVTELTAEKFVFTTTQTINGVKYTFTEAYAPIR
jgi:hypothetical protein